MTTALTPIAGKLAKLLRMLSSNREHEVVAAAKALCRTLEGSGADIHALAAIVEHGGELNQAEMRKLYDAGYEAGMRAVENGQHGPDDFRNTDGLPSWHDMALWCQQRSDRLRANEHEFIDDMAAQTVWREPTERQSKWLRSIYHRLGGRRR
jgi:hypothetical protein